MIRRLATGCLLGWLCLLGGCASLQSVFTGSATSAAAPAAAASGAAAPRVQVQARSDLQALLERHLDLVRLGSVAGAEVISDTEWARLIDATPAQVRELLRTEGYFEPQVQIERQAGGGIVLRLDNGPATRVTALSIEVEGPLQQAAQGGDGQAAQTLRELRSRWALQPGDTFRNAAWGDGKSAALSQLRGAGHAAASLKQSRADIDVASASASLALVLDSGPLFRFGSLQVEGLKAHDLDTVRNLAALGPGDVLTEARLLDFQDRLGKAGLFDQVQVLLDTDPAQAAQARVNVRVREMPLQQATTGVGISANTGARVSLEHVHRRVFGWAATARNKLEWGADKQSWEGELSSHPLPGQYRNLLGGSVQRLRSDTDLVLSQRARLGRTQDTPSIERLYFLETERDVRTTGSSRSESVALTINYHGIWRRLDSAILPTRGFSLALQGGAGQARSSQSASGPFARLYGRFTGYRPLGRGWYAQARLEWGQVVARSGLGVPDSQRFRAGGDDSVRGYAYRSLAPLADGALIGGNTLFTASAEVAHALSASYPSLWWAAFVDTGRAANSWGELKPATGVGLGLRWRSPVGPLRVDLAWGEETRRLRMHFSVGIAF